METVNHPDYYGGEDNTYEAIKVIDAWGAWVLSWECSQVHLPCRKEILRHRDPGSEEGRLVSRP